MARFVRIVTGGLLLALCCAPADTIGAQTPSGGPLPQILDGYDRSDYVAVTAQLANITDLKAFIAQLNGSASTWILAGGETTAAHRRLVAATVALEAAHAHRADWPNAHALMEWGCTLLRTSQARQKGELAWHLAAVALAEGAYDPQDHLAHALSRFPDEPRLLLSRAIVEEGNTWGFDVHQPVWVEVPHVFRDEISPESRVSDMNADLMLKLSPLSGPVPTAAAKSATLWRLANSFLALTPYLAVQPEARVRLSATYLRLARPDSALGQLRQAAATPSGDPFIDYLVHYLSADAHQQLNHTPQAQAEYRAALAVVPHAQSSAIPLAASLFAGPSRSESIDLIAGAVNVPRPVDDPWRLYQTAGFHRWPALLAQLRAELQ